jgi:hypothetical protein
MFKKIGIALLCAIYCIGLIFVAQGRTEAKELEYNSYKTAITVVMNYIEQK